jgi:NADH pyrophosphatase NudC (nudix superfamily)
MKIIEPFKAEPHYMFEYHDCDDFSSLDYQKCRQVYGVCFLDSKLLIAFGLYGGKEKSWGLVGGTIEKGETFEQTLAREVQEESNMKVIKAVPIGYQKVINSIDQSFKYQLRYACIVEPLGDFVSDPAEVVSEIKLIDPKNYKDYFDWGKIGERLILRAQELLF